jgi:hypothetical protein
MRILFLSDGLAPLVGGSPDEITGGRHALKRRTYMATAENCHPLAVERDPVERKFNSEGSDELWIDDLTYIRVFKKLYLHYSGYELVGARSGRLVVQFNHENPVIDHSSPDNGYHSTPTGSKADFPLGPRH